MVHSPASGFIQYCARVYSLDGMKRVCLALQDRHSLNVNLLLAAAWAARHHCRLTPDRVDELRSAMAPADRDAVQPIRALRRAISRNEALDFDLRAGLKRMLVYAEIRAEQAVEAALFEAISSWPPDSQTDLRENVLAVAGAESPELLQFIALVRDSME